VTTRDDIEAHLYRAITGNRLGATSHTVRNAMSALSRFKEPWKVAGVSRETWRRWSNGTQKPSRTKQAGLLAALRRLRLSDARERRIRNSTGIHIAAHDNYEDQERAIGPSTLGWTGGEVRDFLNRLMDAYLLRGISAAADIWLQAMPSNAGWAQEWLHPDANGSSQSMDITSVDLTQGPSRAGRVRRR